MECSASGSQKLRKKFHPPLKKGSDTPTLSLASDSTPCSQESGPSTQTHTVLSYCDDIPQEVAADDYTEASRLGEGQSTSYRPGARTHFTKKQKRQYLYMFPHQKSDKKIGAGVGTHKYAQSLRLIPKASNSVYDYLLTPSEQVTKTGIREDKKIRTKQQARLRK